MHYSTLMKKDSTEPRLLNASVHLNNNNNNDYIASSHGIQQGGTTHDENMMKGHDTDSFWTITRAMKESAANYINVHLFYYICRKTETQKGKEPWKSTNNNVTGPLNRHRLTGASFIAVLLSLDTHDRIWTKPWEKQTETANTSQHQTRNILTLLNVTRRRTCLMINIH